MRVLTAVVVAGFLVGIGATGALAHKGKLPEDALTLVRQASGLLAQNPGMSGEARERLEAALTSKKTAGVNLEQVREALAALEKRDIAAVRRLLLAAIAPTVVPQPSEGTKPPASTPAPVVGPIPSPAPPAPMPMSPPQMELAMRMAEPLKVGFTRSTVETVLLAVSLALIGFGVAALWRSRGEARG